MRFTLHAVPVDQLTRTEDVVRELLGEAMRCVRPTLVLLDRGFYAGGVVRTLLDLGMDFLIPVPRTRAVQRVLRETRHLWAWVGTHAVGEDGPEVTLAILVNQLLQPGAFDERRLLRMEDFLERLLEAVRFRRRTMVAA